MSSTPKITPIRKVLVANRGEIACRVMRTCRQMGIATVAVFSSVDSNAMHTRFADESVFIGEPQPNQSYLVMEKIIAACKKSGADAVHPGYGFLSENEKFAQLCLDNGINFIGPPPDTIVGLGNKSVVKNLMKEKCPSVPLIPGYNGADQSVPTLMKEAEKMGFPILCKAAAGGGGKGMRVVRNLKEMESSIGSVISEAKSSFGDDRILLEKFFDSARHIEFQIFGDKHGNVIHLNERDCSVQRRYQKVVEETPSPFMTEELRAKMGAAAVTIGKMCNYVGAGTVEFLVDDKRNFYFLEVNTRLQVEHPITETVCGLDLVQLQLQAAMGYHFKDIQMLPEQRAQELAKKEKGQFLPAHSIECRLYAEDPLNNFFPATGKLICFRPSNAAFARFDTGVESGSDITVFYDPLIAKVLTWGTTRKQSIQRMIHVLTDTTVLGLTTNKQFLIDCLKERAFYEGVYDTRFIKMYLPAKVREEKSMLTKDMQTELAIVANLYDWSRRVERRLVLKHIPSGYNGGMLPRYTKASFTVASMKSMPTVDLWYHHDTSAQPSLSQLQSAATQQSSLTTAKRFHFRNTDPTQSKEAAPAGAAGLKVSSGKEKKAPVDPKTCEVTLLGCVGSGEEGRGTAGHLVECVIDSLRRRYVVTVGDGGDLSENYALEMFVHHPAYGSYTVKRHSRFEVAQDDSASTGNVNVLAPMPCKIVSIQFQDGAAVKKNDLVVVVESMKMEMKIFAEGSGKAKVLVRVGDIVKQGQKLLMLENEPVANANAR